MVVDLLGNVGKHSEGVWSVVVVHDMGIVRWGHRYGIRMDVLC